MVLERKLRSPVFAAEPCLRSLSGSYGPKFPQNSNFLFVLAKTPALEGSTSCTAAVTEKRQSCIS